jgi:hypothetical protein
MANRGVGAYVTVKYYLSTLIDEDTLNEWILDGTTFDEFVKEMIEDESIIGMADEEFEILSIEKVFEDDEDF